MREEANPETHPYCKLPQLARDADPETVKDVTRAAHYLEAITEHFLEFGPWWEKTAADLVYELDYHNAWHQYEIEMERKGGEKAAVYQPIRLTHLQARSREKIQALEEHGGQETESYRMTAYVDQLIAEALAEEQELESYMDTPPPAISEDDVPFYG